MQRTNIFSTAAEKALRTFERHARSNGFDDFRLDRVITATFKDSLKVAVRYLCEWDLQPEEKLDRLEIAIS